MRRGALTHPKMRRLARLLRVRVAEAYGLVSGLLDWAYHHATDGAVGRWDDEEIAHGAHCECADGPTFIRALLEAGWLDHDSGKRLVIHDLADHADDTWRKMLARRGKSFATADGVPQVPENTRCPDKVQTESRQSPDFVWDIEPDRAREEPDRARPDIENASRSLPRARITHVYSEDFERFWVAYPRKKEKPLAYRAWTELAPDAGLIEVMLAALERQKLDGQWLDQGGRFVIYPERWLKRRRWEDEPDRPAVAFSGRTAGNAAALQAVLVQIAERGKP